jgi:hypothetical protein
VLRVRSPVMLRVIYGNVNFEDFAKNTVIFGKSKTALLFHSPALVRPFRRLVECGEERCKPCKNGVMHVL